MQIISVCIYFLSYEFPRSPRSDLPRAWPQAHAAAQLIFSLLHDNTTHPTADALYATASHKMPGISLRTVYQTLNELAEMGELQTIDLGEA